MKRGYILIGFLLLSIFATAQSYKWIKGGGSTTTMLYSRLDEQVTQMCTDANKNLYITSFLGDNVKADTFVVAATHNNGYGSYSHLIFASYRCDGTMRWAKILESENDSRCYGLAYDGAGNIYFAGIMAGGNKYIGTDTFINKQYIIAFLSKFDTAGKLKWINFIGPDIPSTSNNLGASGQLAIDGSGYIHYYAYARSGTQLTPTVVSVLGTYDLKFDATGNLLNAIRMQMDGTYMIYRGALNISDNTLYAIMYDPSGSLPAYTTAINAAGVQLWSDTIYSGSVFDLIYDGTNNIYGVGGGTPLIIGKDTVTNKYFTDFIRIDTNGNSRLLHGFYGSGASLYRIALLPNGQLSATSEITSYLVNGPDTMKPLPGGNHPILCIVDTSGRVIKLDQFISAGFYDWGTAITSDKDANIYIGGQVEDNITATGLGAGYTSNGGNTDFFVAKYGYNCNCTLANEPTPNYTYTGSGTVNFTYTGAITPDSVRWNFGDGGTSTSINPTHNFHDTGLHHVCLTVYACDSGSYCGYVHTTVSVPTSPVLSKGEVMVYPNPISGAFFIEGAEMGTVVKLFNVMGQDLTPTLSKGEGVIIVKSSREQINTGDLRVGVYVLQLINREGQKSNVTIVKQ